jgi:hypothetical protein
LKFVFSLFTAFFISLLLGQTSAYAKLDFEDHAFPEFVTSARALAMGNAYICKVDDSYSAFYNPAGLGTVRGAQFHLLNAQVEGSSGLFNVIGDGAATQAPGKYQETFDPNKLRSKLLTHQGKLVESRIGTFPNITVKGLTLGYLYSQRNLGIINNDTANNFEVAQRKDQGPVMALNGGLFGGVFKFGASAVYLARQELNKSFAPNQQVAVTGNDYRSGKSLQLTLGGKLTFPVSMLPTLAAVLRNASQKGFEAAANGGLPSSIKQTLDVGFSITPQIGQITRLHLEANLKDMNNSYHTDVKRRMAAGMELDFNRRIFFRVGWGDGWGSGGIGVRNRVFQLDLTTYAVDRSLDGFRKLEDRRFMLSISSGF